MQWSAVSYHLKIQKRRTCTKKLWPVNSKSPDSSRPIARTLFQRFFRQNRASVTGSNRFVSIRGIDSSETNSLRAYSLVRKSCLSRIVFTSRYWTNLDLIPTMLLSVLRPTDTTTSRLHTTYSTSVPFASASLSQTSHTSQVAWTEQLWLNMSAWRLPKRRMRDNQDMVLGTTGNHELLVETPSRILFMLSWLEALSIILSTNEAQVPTTITIKMPTFSNLSMVGPRLPT